MKRSCNKHNYEFDFDFPTLPFNFRSLFVFSREKRVFSSNLEVKKLSIKLRHNGIRLTKFYLSLFRDLYLHCSICNTYKSFLNRIIDILMIVQTSKTNRYYSETRL
jgi:hypothetical protein